MLMSNRFSLCCFPFQNRRSEQCHVWFLFWRPSSLKIGARFWTTFRLLNIENVLYFQAYLILRVVLNRECVPLERFRLVETSALTAFLSRSSRWQMTNIVHRLKPQLRLLVASHGFFDEDPLLWRAWEQFIPDRLIITRKAPGLEALSCIKGWRSSG